MKNMNSTSSTKSDSKTSLTGFVRFLGTISKADLIGYILLVLVVFPVAFLYSAITLPSRAFYPTEDETPYLSSLVTRTWTRYKESLSK